MLSNTTGFVSVSGPYALLAYDRDSGRVDERHFSSLQELAQAVNSMLEPAPRWSNDPCDHGVKRFTNVRAYSPRGRALDVAALVAFGRKLNAERTRRWWYARFPGYVRRRGPVHGIRKWRGGGSCHGYRHMNERRAAACVLHEEGEVPPRAARNVHNLHNPWDDERWSSRPRCWKSQHKGCKAWDR